MTIQNSLASIPLRTLSESRITDFLSGDFQKATKLNIIDKFVDIFRTNSKESALQNLAKMLEDSGTSNFFRFNLISQLAEPSKNSIFTIQISPHPNEWQKFNIEYCINGDPIKTDVINSHEKDTISNHMGKPLDAAFVNENITSIDHYKVDTQELIHTVKDQDFAGGGVNKKFHSTTGLLRADTRTGEEDFDRELALAEYAQDKPELASYISTQKKIDCPANLNSKHAYAIVDVYDKEHIKSTEMDQCIDDLSRDQAKSLLPQLVDMSRVMYKNKVAHRDLHMHNLVIHQIKDTGTVHLKAIDFGRMVMAENFEEKKFEDIDYLFSKQGSTMLETFGRNVLAREGSDVEKKHYPIHKLCNKFNEKGISLDGMLAKIGEHLKSDLQHAGDDEAKIDAAFQQASETLQLSFAQLSPTNHFGIVYA